MADKKSMSVDEFNLLARAIHREWIRDPSRITSSGDSLFYRDANTNSGGLYGVHMFSCSSSRWWPTVGTVEFVVNRPVSLWSGKDKRKFDEAATLLCEIFNRSAMGSTEELICKHVPSAKDLIAEKVLVEGDNGN